LDIGYVSKRKDVISVPDLGTGKLGSCLGRHQKRGAKITKRGGAKRIKGAPKKFKRC